MFARQRNYLTDLFSKIHQLQLDPLGRVDLLLAIHEELIARISQTERRIRIYRTRTSSLKAKLAVRGSDRGRSDRLKDALATNREEIQVAQALIAALRDVGDGIVFIYLDRWDVKPFAFRDPPGSLSGKRGSRLERASLRLILRNGLPAVLNDITHCMRYGDITGFHAGEFILIEAKSGRGGSYSRQARQKESTEKVLNYLRTDRVEGLYVASHPMVRIGVNSPPKYYVDEINQLVASVKPNEWGYAEVEPGLHYYVARGNFDATSLIAAFDGLDLILPLPFVISCDTIERQARYPLLLSLEDPDRIYELYNGDLSIFVIADFGAVHSILDSHDLVVSLSSDPERPVVIQHNSQEFQQRSSWHFISRIGYEFLSMKWWCDEAVARWINVEQVAKFALGDDFVSPSTDLNDAIG